MRRPGTNATDRYCKPATGLNCCAHFLLNHDARAYTPGASKVVFSSFCINILEALFSSLSTWHIYISATALFHHVLRHTSQWTPGCCVLRKEWILLHRADAVIFVWRRKVFNLIYYWNKFRIKHVGYQYMASFFGRYRRGCKWKSIINKWKTIINKINETMVNAIYDWMTK